MGQPSFLRYMGLDTASNAPQLLGAIGALFFGGGVFGCFIGSFVADRWGRKAAMALGASLQIVSAALLTGSVNVVRNVAIHVKTTTDQFPGHVHRVSLFERHGVRLAIFTNAEGL